MNKLILSLSLTLLCSSMPAFSQAKNVILFVGDGAGISSMNAAAIYGYGKPQSLFLYSMPHVALAETSTAKEWVTDAAACASAWATGKKGRNGSMSMSPEAIRDVRDGEIYKTVMEYAMENGLSTGIVSNGGVAGAAVSSFYAHHNNRSKAGEIFAQALHPKFGKGPDVIIGTGRKQISDQTRALGKDLAMEVKASGHAYLDSMEALAKVDSSNSRIIALFDDAEFNFNEAVQQAVTRLSKNPKGYLLIAHSDCHTGKSRTSLQRLVDLDQSVASTAKRLGNGTLILFTADHSYDLRLKGESLTETAKDADHKKITSAVSLEDEHTAEEVPFLGMGPGSERIGGFMANTDVFHVMMAYFGWSAGPVRK